MNEKKSIATIDEYISEYPSEIQDKLQQLRCVIQESAPEATEKMSWQMPTFYLNGNLIHFAAHSKHMGLYPGAEAMEVFKEKLSEYKTSKGAVQFPFNKPMPFDLVREIVKFRVEENKK